LSLFLKRLAVIMIFLSLVFGCVFFAYKKWTYFTQNRKAKKCFYSSDYTKALEHLSKLPDKKTVKSKKQLQIEYMRAMSYLKTGKEIESEDHWNKICLNTKYVEFKDEANYYLGQISWKKEDLEKSKEYFMKILDRYPESPYVGDSLYYIASLHLKDEEHFKARDLFEKIVENYPNSQNIEEVIKRLGELNIKLLFTKIETPISEFYIVKPGDSLALIAKKFNTTVDLLLESNEMKTPRINPNDRIKIITAKFNILIDKSQNILLLKADDKFFKKYLVGTGKKNSTPIGAFKIVEKLKNPTWYMPDGGVAPFGSKENLLGTRWMSINYPGYGIHGTWAPDSVGKQSSMGCIRLRNKEVEELYKIVPVGTEVTIVD